MTMWAELADSHAQRSEMACPHNIGRTVPRVKIGEAIG